MILDGPNLRWQVTRPNMKERTMQPIGSLVDSFDASITLPFKPGIWFDSLEISSTVAAKLGGV